MYTPASFFFFSDYSFRETLKEKGYACSDVNGQQILTLLSSRCKGIDKKEKKKKKKMRQKEKKSQETERSGEKFQAVNHVSKTLSMGIRVQDLKPGYGKAVQRGKLLEVSYVGRFDDKNGKVFDRSKGSPFSFRLGAGEVIKGWDIGIMGMKEGGKRRIYVPPVAGYGRKRSGKIPGNSTLCFEVTVVRVQ